MASRKIPGTGSAKFPAAPSSPRTGRMSAAPRSTQLRDLQGRFAGGFGVSWVGLDEVAALMASATALPQRTEDIMKRVGEEAINYAKKNARWEDDTGIARGEGAPNTDPAHLHYALVREANHTFSLYLAHGPEYGVYLEANPDYAILAEALLHASGMAGQVANDEMQKALGRRAL